MTDFTTVLRPGGVQIRLAQARRLSRHAIRAAGAVTVVAIVLSTTRQPSPPVPAPGDALLRAELAAPVEPIVDRAGQYTWLSKRQRREYVPLADRIPMPAGFTRVETPVGSFADWLRHLPTAPAGEAVRTARSAVVLAADHPNLGAVIALRPRSGRLLDAVNMLIRLRAEHRWATENTAGLSFHFTSGDRVSWRGWAGGVRPVVSGRKVQFRRTAKPDAGRASFCRYLETVFRYASTHSLMDDTRAAEDRAVWAGDVFLRRGRPGHALMILDIATDGRGRVKVLLGEGGTPAQAFHVLRNDAGSAWFLITQTRPIDLGRRGVFTLKDLRHWAD